MRLPILTDVIARAGEEAMAIELIEIGFRNAESYVPAFGVDAGIKRVGCCVAGTCWSQCVLPQVNVFDVVDWLIGNGCPDVVIGSI